MVPPLPQPYDRFTAARLHLWYGLAWAVVGVAPTGLAVREEPPATAYTMAGLLALLTIGYGLVSFLPRNPALRPQIYLVVLGLGLGAVSYLLAGAAALYVVSLPQFWVFADTTRSALRLSGFAAATTALGGLLPQGWSPHLLTGNTIATLIAYAASVAVGLWAYRFIGLNQARADALAAELAEAQKELVQAHQRQGAADERERLAREIHDTLAQGFASIIVLAEAARSGVHSDPAKSAQQLLSIEQTARENLTEARVLVGSAPQSGVAPGSVAQALRRTLDRFVQDTGLIVEAELGDVVCDQRTRIALLRCTQESLANVRKHAAASTVGVVLARLPYGVELEITDDGRGFVVDDSYGFGLDGMRKRLAELDGELSVTSSLGDGTRILATIPLADDERPGTAADHEQPMTTSRSRAGDDN
ncbi:sensor histidine kinase [Streptomyces zagrosensis]|uniref:Signal transduction histidine kinase n=1 Tax=Streptomyces zagrosensis TaxID=1042984 RepID=A0A7W9QIW1_9ACTN|nr:sensor histidine kinase [Streptomyces zagrosensis]MBB5940062.1 signal transduction histidine kinase [Streptomyces zagrosensis]